MGIQVGNNSPLHLRRIAWLKRNKKLWDGYDSFSYGSLATEKLLLDKMIKAKLYPTNTTLLDVGIERLIHKIRTAGRRKKFVAREDRS